MLESGRETSEIRVDSREDWIGVWRTLLPASLKY